MKRLCSAISFSEIYNISFTIFFTSDLPLVEKAKERRLERKRDLVGSRVVEVGRERVENFQAQKEQVEN